MTDKHKIIGPIKINFPDENDNSFSIFEDCAELFGQEFQSDAYKLLKAKLKDTKPKPSMDYESDYLHVTTANVDTIISTIEAIIELSNSDYQAKFPKLDIDDLKKEFTNVKKNRPKPKEWATGDVFTIILKDNSFTFGQVLDKKYCTCALFDFRANTDTLNSSDFKKLKPISILHLSNGDLLNNGHWKILFNEQVTLNPNSGSGGKFGDIGSISYGQCGALTDLADAYWGLTPWNALYKEDYYDKMLLKNVSRPKTAIILNSADRKQYRKEKYGIEEKEETTTGNSTLPKAGQSWLKKLFGSE